eukprot:352909-Chlamydomonas_euryale.AAC.2
MQSGDSRGRFRAGPLVTNLKLLQWTLHSASVSADQHVRPQGSIPILVYAPGLRILRPAQRGTGTSRRAAPQRQLGRAGGHAHFQGALARTSAVAERSRELGAAAWRRCVSHRLAD